MTTAAGTERVRGDLLEIVEAGDFSRLRPADFKDLVPIRDHYSRQVDQFSAAETQVRRVEQLREEQVIRHVDEGTLGLLTITDLPILVRLREAHERKLQQVEAAVRRCPVRAAANDPDPFGDDVQESNATNVDDRGPGDDDPPGKPGMFPTPQAAVAVLGLTGGISLATTYAGYRAILWLAAALS